MPAVKLPNNASSILFSGKTSLYFLKNGKIPLEKPDVAEFSAGKCWQVYCSFSNVWNTPHGQLEKKTATVCALI